MKKEEVIEWLMIMKANLNNFPEVSNAKKIEALGEAIRFLKNEESEKPRWIPVSERLPTQEEYIANNGLFIVTDGNRTYAEYFDVYNSKKFFGEPTMNGFRVDRCVIAWMPLPEPYSEVEE